jgi:hypothetical protein
VTGHFRNRSVLCEVHHLDLFPVRGVHKRARARLFQLERLGMGTHPFSSTSSRSRRAPRTVQQKPKHACDCNQQRLSWRCGLWADARQFKHLVRSRTLPLQPSPSSVSTAARRAWLRAAHFNRLAAEARPPYRAVSAALRRTPRLRSVSKPVLLVTGSISSAGVRNW